MSHRKAGNMEFLDVLQRWGEAQRKAELARIQYDVAYAEALIRADGPVEVRKAKAELAAANAERVFVEACVEAKALERQLDYIVSHGETPKGVAA